MPNLLRAIVAANNPVTRLRSRVLTPEALNSAVFAQHAGVGHATECVAVIRAAG